MPISYETYVALAALITTLVGSTIGWLIADTKAKTKAQFIEDKLQDLGQASTRSREEIGERILSLEVKSARTNQDSIEIHRMLDRLDAQKASKEIVDGFRAELVSLKTDMDRRFDKIERMLERHFERINVEEKP